VSIREVEDAPQPEPGQPEPGKPGSANKKWMTAVGGLVCVFVVLAGYDLVSNWTSLGGLPAASSTVSAAGTRPAAKAAASAVNPAPSPSLSPASATAAATAAPPPSAGQPPAHALSVVSVAAFGPGGTSDGDNPGTVSRIIDGGGEQPWYSSWYTTPEFGGLQSGTGFLLDMGATVTVSRVRLVLGDSAGADVQVRVGNVAAPADLSAAASASDVGGTVDLRMTSSASGRYVLVWFTRLPPNSQGEYQVSVYRATVDGAAGA
jgi:hypothetical protein